MGAISASDRRTRGILRLTEAAEEQPGQAIGAVELAPREAQKSLGAISAVSGAQSCLPPADRTSPDGRSHRVHPDERSERLVLASALYVAGDARALAWPRGQGGRR